MAAADEEKDEAFNVRRVLDETESEKMPSKSLGRLRKLFNDLDLEKFAPGTALPAAPSIRLPNIRIKKNISPEDTVSLHLTGEPSCAD